MFAWKCVIKSPSPAHAPMLMDVTCPRQVLGRSESQFMFLLILLRTLSFWEIFFPLFGLRGSVKASIQPALEEEIWWMNTDRLHEETSRILGVLLKIIQACASRQQWLYFQCALRAKDPWSHSTTWLVRSLRFQRVVFNFSLKNRALVSL